MIGRYTLDVTSQRLLEIEQAIAEQRRHAASLADPALKATAVRTLATLEDMLLIMERTRGLLTRVVADRSEERR